MDKLGITFDFHLSSTRRFLDNAATWAGAVAELKAGGKCPMGTRQVKYLNNVVEPVSAGSSCRSVP